jgi:hypothetical protein
MSSGRFGSYVKSVGTLVCALVLLALPATARAAPIQPGFDLFETDPSATVFNFAPGDTEIPATFFGPGSDPFHGAVAFGGVPLTTFLGVHPGDADTVVQRPQASADPMPTAPPIPIQLVQLSLVSMQPITVTYNGGQNPEPWQVNAQTGSQASQGQMTITHPTLTGAGGTFSSTLRVLPLLTFTRLSDGHQATLDAGALQPATKDKLVLGAQNVPWSPGCKLPALALSGINDGFCPGLNSLGRNKRTVEQAQLAQHGIYPVQPALEHFRCYRVEQAPFQPRTVNLKDQFGSRQADISKRAELCNPAKKNQEPFQNRRAHLQCYATTGQPVGAVVAVQNQFGSQRLRVGKPKRLCVPSKKRLSSQNPFPPIQVPIDHYQCYAVTPQASLQTVNPVHNVTLKDEFGQEQVSRAQPFQLCAPARKTFQGHTTPAQHVVKHLVCYQTNGAPVNRGYEIKNQFEQRRLLATQPFSLCVPSNKLVITP